jgi:endonuclease/exonuclease/phosphatase family metal-dependent hydrolase
LLALRTLASRRRNGRSPATFAIIACALSACIPPLNADSAGGPNVLKLATWNLEWLIAPATFKELKKNCAPEGSAVPGKARRLPCDVARTRERATRDFLALARYAKSLDADVIALQEVDGPEVARRVFPDYEFCFTSRPHLQNNGFAIRRGLAHRCARDHHALSLGDRLRRGAEVILFPDRPGEIHLLSVHLKSGCHRGPLDSPEKPCADLSRQVSHLEAWADARARPGARFAILGDFNRTLLQENGAPRSPTGRLRQMWPELDDGDPPESDLLNAAEGQPFRNCTPGQGFRDYIDFIILSRSLGTAMVPGSFERLTYAPKDARRSRLSDHCPVAVRLRLP